MKFLRRKFGQDTVDRITARMSEEARKTSSTALVGSMYPIEHLGELIDAVAAELGIENPEINFRIARESFKTTFSLLYKILLKFGNPHFILKRTDAVWRKFASAGNLKCVEESDGRAVVRLTNFDFENEELCSQRLRGGFQALLELSGCKVIDAQHSACRVRGDPYCEWLFTWTM
jgi:hypothetical protein